MPSINEVATQKVFKDLTCAYTGKKVTVRVVAAGGSRPLFFSPDAFDPSLPADSLPELLRKASRRNGVEGAVSDENVLKCPYTGAPMSILKDASGFSLTGGFRPSCPDPDASRFAYNMTLRNGISTREKPVTGGRVEFTDERPVVYVTGSTGPKDYAMEHAEDALKHILPVKTSVTQTADAPRKRRKV